jgi:hypothetical protein
MNHYTVKSDTYLAKVTVTAVRMPNDMDGNPRYKVQVWSASSGTIWCPKVIGYRRSKDDTYVLKSVYDLNESLNNFMKVFEESINV